MATEQISPASDPVEISQPLDAAIPFAIKQRVRAYLQVYQLSEDDQHIVYERVLVRLHGLMQTQGEISFTLAVQECQMQLNQWFNSEKMAEMHPLLAVHIASLCWHRLERLTQNTLSLDHTLPLLQQIDELANAIAQPTPPAKWQAMPLASFDFFSLSQFLDKIGVKMTKIAHFLHWRRWRTRRLRKSYE
ncbi:hypothetical protein [Thioflexithrix psekupsensis]|uniref:Uncharacterized protein n=1 Tax=Thioflexithrix psekupsensis TaxID=1570016 RepID=A0A251X7P4_9GAMM|nr:hypothetical protein [Thioflexithrix psekupsensis]OUD13960.1 hypothetical protein TPSD3_06345 [Thioflexithrix psekupsensis]